jgi:hypothetical protein
MKCLTRLGISSVEVLLRCGLLNLACSNVDGKFHLCCSTWPIYQAEKKALAEKS